MARKVIEIFLSSTAKDLAAYRTAVHDRLMRTGLFHCIWQEDFGAQNAGAVDFCRKHAQACDMFVGLIGLRRGWEPDGDNQKRSITEMEHDWAKEAGRPRYLWTAPGDFKVPDNLREPDDQHARQKAFRDRVMAGGERIVSQRGFESEQLFASEIVEHLLTQVVTGDLIAHVISDLPHHDRPSITEQKPAVAAAVEKLAEDKDVDLLKLAKNPQGIDLADLESKLKMRAEAQEALGRQHSKASAEYWRHIGALAFLHNTQKALAGYEKATALDPNEPDGWRYLGELQFRLGDLAAAERAFETLVTLGMQTQNKGAESTGYLRLGWIHMSHGDLSKAEQMQRKALKIDEELSSKEGMARAYGNLGLIYGTRGDLTKAQEMLLKALKINEGLGNKGGIATAYGNLGVIHETRGDLTKAEEMQLKALKIDEELSSKQGMARAYDNLGLIYRTRGDLTKAEEMHLKALKINEELGSEEGRAGAYGNLGNIYGTRGDLTKAEEMYLKALKIDEELGRKEGMAIAYGNLGNVYAARQNKRRMCECWRKERDLWREMGLTDKAAEIERWLKRKGCEDF
jgi:tetratricopeptide (TPR) repeat protein